MIAIDVRHRYPWTAEDERFLARAKVNRVCHKRIAQVLQRSPRAVDEKIYKLKQERRYELLLNEAAADGLSEFDRLERDTLEQVLREARR